VVDAVDVVEDLDEAELESPDLADLEGVEVDVVDATVTEEPDEAAEADESGPRRGGKNVADPDFVWDEEESEALRQARKDAELTASADSVRAYLKQIGKVALLNAKKKSNSPSASRPVFTRPNACAAPKRKAKSSPPRCAGISNGSSAMANAPRTIC